MHDVAAISLADTFAIIIAVLQVPELGGRGKLGPDASCPSTYPVTG